MQSNARLVIAVATLVAAFAATGAAAPPSPQSFMDGAKAPTDATQAAACIASTEKAVSSIEAFGTQTAMDMQQYMGEGIGDSSKVTADTGDAMTALLSPELQTCALMLPSQAQAGFATVNAQLEQKLDTLRAERDKLCNAQPDQGEGGCDASVANRVIHPKVVAALNAFYAAAAVPLTKLKNDAQTCINKRRPLEDKLMPVGGAMAMQAVSARTVDLAVAGAYVGAVHELCQSALTALQEFQR